MRIGMTSAEHVKRPSSANTVMQSNQGEAVSNNSFLQQLEEEAEKEGAADC